MLSYNPVASPHSNTHSEDYRPPQKKLSGRRLTSGYASNHSTAAGLSPVHGRGSGTDWGAPRTRRLVKRRPSVQRSRPRDVPKKDGPQDKAEAEASICKNLPEGFRALTQPHGFALEDGYALYGCTTRWPFVKNDLNEAAPMGAVPRYAPLTGGDMVSAESLRWGHGSSFKAACTPEAAKGDNMQARGSLGNLLTRCQSMSNAMTQSRLTMEDTSLQIYLSPNTAATGMTVTHLFLSGQCIGDVFLFVPDTHIPPAPSRTPPPQTTMIDGAANSKRLFVEDEFLEPLAHQSLRELAAGRSIRDACPRHRLVPLLPCEGTGAVQEYRVLDPVFAPSALLVVVHEGELSDAAKARRGCTSVSPRMSPGGANSAGGACTFGAPGGRFGLLSPAANTPFFIDGKQYPTLLEYMERRPTQVTGELTERELYNSHLYKGLRAKFDQNPSARKMLLSTGNKTLMYLNASDGRMGAMSDMQGLNLLGKFLERLRGELAVSGEGKEAAQQGPREAPNVEDIVKRWGGAVSAHAKDQPNHTELRSTVLDVTRLDVLGYDSDLPLSPEHPDFSLLCVVDRLCTPFYVTAIQNDVINAARWIKMLNDMKSKSMPGILQMGVRNGSIKGSTPLHAAAKCGNIDMIELLLGNDVDAFCQNEKGSTPLHNAVLSGSVQAVRVLLKDTRGEASCSATNCQGCTPLMVAIERKRRDLVPLLFRGDDQLVRQVDGASVMHIAARKHDLYTIRLLRQYIDPPLGQLTARYETVLHWAVMGVSERDRGGTDGAANLEKVAKANERIGRVLDELIDMDADIWQMDVDGNTVLHTAAEAGCEVAVLRVLQAAKDQWKDLLYTRKNQHNCFTPLMSAAANNRTGVMELILSRRWTVGSVRFFQSGDLQNALVVAAERGHHEVLQKYGDQLQKDVYYNYDWAAALINAAEKNLVPVVSYLMEKGVWPNVQLNSMPEAAAEQMDSAEKWGDATPLLVACHKAHHEVVALLLKQASEVLPHEDITEFFTLRNGPKGPTPLLAAVTAWNCPDADPDDVLKTVDYLLGFAKQEAINIDLTNVAGLDPWCVLARSGVTIQLTDAPGSSINSVNVTSHSGRKVHVPYGGDIGVLKFMNRMRTRVAVELPERGWIAFDPQQPCIVPIDTPLHVAIGTKSVRIVKKLLRHYTDRNHGLSTLEQPDRRGWTPLLLAASLGGDDMVRLLLRHGADPQAITADKETILHILAEKTGTNADVEAILACYADHVLNRRLRGSVKQRSSIAATRSPSMMSGAGVFSLPSAYFSADVAEAKQSPHHHLHKYIEQILEQSQSPTHLGKSALEIACSQGAVTVVGWILGQYQAAMPLLAKEQVERVVSDQRRGFELAVEKLPLQVRSLKSTRYFLSTAHAGQESDPVVNWAAIVNIMMQHSVPIPSSIVPGGTDTTAATSPLVKLFRLILKLPVEKFVPPQVEQLDLKVTASPPLHGASNPGSPIGGNTAASEVSTFPRSPRAVLASSIGATRLMIPLCQDWTSTDDAAAEKRCLAVGSHEVLLTLSIALQGSSILSRLGASGASRADDAITHTTGNSDANSAFKTFSPTEKAEEGGASGNMQRLRASLSFALPMARSQSPTSGGKVPAGSPFDGITAAATSGSLPFDEVELLYSQANVYFEGEWFGKVCVRLELVTTQTGLHIQFRKISPVGDDVRIRINREKPAITKNGFLAVFDHHKAAHDEYPQGQALHDIHVTLRGSEPVSYGFYFISCLEGFSVESWARGLSEDEAIEYSVEIEGRARAMWTRMTRSHCPTGLSDPGPVITNFSVSIDQLRENPLSCSQHDLFLVNLSRKQDRPDEFVLFRRAHVAEIKRNPPSSCTSYVWGRIVMSYLRQLVNRQVGGNQTPLKVFDVVGAELQAPDEVELYTWIRAPGGLLSNLSELRFTSREFGLIDVSPNVDPRIEEVRPLASLCASGAGNNFALDMKYITCTVVDSSRRCVYDQHTRDYKTVDDYQQVCGRRVDIALQRLQQLVDQEDLLAFLNKEAPYRGPAGNGGGKKWTIDRLKELLVPWKSVEDVMNASDGELQLLPLSHTPESLRARAEEEAHRLSIYPMLSEENYTEYFATDFPGRKDVLLRLMQSPNVHVIDAVNEALDYLATRGRGVEIDLERFASQKTPERSRFSMEHTKHLFEYIKRKKAAMSLKFRNLNFIHDSGEDGTLRDFIRSKLLCGLSCTSIDFGKDNKHTGEIFLTLATSLGPSREEESSGVAADSMAPHANGGHVQNGHSVQLDKDGAWIGAGAEDPLEMSDNGPPEMSPTATSGGADKDARTPLCLFFLEGVPFFVTDELRNYPLHYLIQLLHERKQANPQPDDLPNALAPPHGEAVCPKLTTLYQSTFRVAQHVIQFLSSHDPCYFLECGKKKCNGITPLRLAIHYQLDDLIELMIGLKRNRLAGLLKRQLTYEPERLEMDHFVDIWGCAERDNEGLLPLHAAIISIGVCDSEDAAEKNLGDLDNGGLQRLRRPYQLQTSPEPDTNTAIHFTDLYERSVVGISMRHDEPDGGVEDKTYFLHPKALVEVMQKVQLLQNRERLVTYIDTIPESDLKLGVRAHRALVIARLLIECSFVPRSIKVAGNPPPRGSKQYVDVPQIIDSPTESYFADRTRTTPLLTSHVWERTGINETIIPKEYHGGQGRMQGDEKSEKSNTLILTLKFAPFLISELYKKWGDMLNMHPLATLEPCLGTVHLQVRRNFRATKHILNSTEPNIGFVEWDVEDSGLNLGHWAAIRDQRRLLEKVTALDGSVLVETTSELHQTPLHLACYAGSLDCLNVLLPRVTERGVGLNWVDAEGNTPLHTAVSLCHPVCCDALADYGAKAHWKNEYELDPHDVAIAVLLHHTCQENAFRESNLMRDWERDRQILETQVQVLTKDPQIQRKLARAAWRSFFLRACLYIVLLSVMCVVVDHRTDMFDPSRYYARQGIMNILDYESSETFLTLEDVRTTREMYIWMRYQVENLFSTNFLDPNPLFGLLFLSGAVRLRQVRIHDDTCIRPEWVNEYWTRTGCYGAWSSDIQMKEDWHQDTPFVSQKNPTTFYAWKTHLDRFYPESGYIVDLNPMDKEGAVVKLEQLESDEWTDLQTRAVFLDLNFYNPNDNRWTVTRILFEFSEHGPIVGSERVIQTRLDSCVPFAKSRNLLCDTDYKTLIFCLEVGLLMSVLSLTYNELYDLYAAGLHAREMSAGEKSRVQKEKSEEEAEKYYKKRGKDKGAKFAQMLKRKRKLQKKTMGLLMFISRVLSNYLLRDWNIIDALSVALFWMAFANRIEFIIETKDLPTEEMIVAAGAVGGDYYYDMWRIASAERAERDLCACVLVLYFIKLLKHLMLLPKIGPFVTAITHTIGDIKVIVFFLVFTVISSAFILGLHVVLGQTHHNHKSVWDTSVTFLQLVMGQWQYESMTEDSWLITPLLFVAALVLTNLIMINIFIALVGQIYAQNFKTSQEKWSWQVIDEYQYKLTDLPDPSRRAGNFILLFVSHIISVVKERCGKTRTGRRGPDDAAESRCCRLTTHAVTAGGPEVLPPRVMRKEAAIRYLRTQNKIQMSLHEVTEGLRMVSETVSDTAGRMERMTEQLERLDTTVGQLQAAVRDDLRDDRHAASSARVDDEVS